MQTKHARRVYIGGVPQGTTDRDLTMFIVDIVSRSQPLSVAQQSVMSVHLNTDKMYSFVELNSIELTTAMCNLDGVKFKGATLKIRRPNDFRPELVIESSLGPIPVLDVAGLGVISTNVADGPNKMFIGGIPKQLNEEHVKEILQAFGNLKAFNLVRETGSSESKGYAFCEYMDGAVTATAVEGLNGLPIMDKQLTVKIATSLQSGGKASSLPGGPPNPLLMATSLPTSVIVLKNMVTKEEVNDDAEYDDILEDVRGECSQYGHVVRVLMPRSKDRRYPVETEGNVFVQFSSISESQSATRALSGRKFADRTVVVDFFDEAKFARDELV
jgi:splicing factor U2AF 65 kDa subunit